jgi:hypothetical protein
MSGIDCEKIKLRDRCDTLLLPHCCGCLAVVAAAAFLPGGIAEMFMNDADHEEIKLRDRKGFVRIAGGLGLRGMGGAAAAAADLLLEAVASQVGERGMAAAAASSQKYSFAGTGRAPCALQAQGGLRVH